MGATAVIGRHRARPTLRKTLERALNRASFAFTIAITLLMVWHFWPTDGSAPRYLPDYQFHLRL